MLRSRAFVDGLNLYHGMESADLLEYRWLDIRRLCELVAADVGATLGEPLEVGAITYCTSFVSDSQKQSRQDLYLQALAAHCFDLRILFGRYESKTRPCKCECGCQNTVAFQKEKRTDTNLAVEMVSSASEPAESRPDVIILITGDTDLVPAIDAVRNRFGVRVAVAAPPARHQDHLGSCSDVYTRIGRRHLKYAPLPAVVIRPDNGYPLTPPGTWAAPAAYLG
jgi:uncharacterized LabA/DUF88 family protein